MNHRVGRARSPRGRFPLSALLGPVVAALVLGGTPLAGQADLPSDSPLSAAGFSPGQVLSAVAARARALGGATLACDRSRADSRVLDCRALVRDSLGRHFDLWLSAVDSAVSVLTLSATFADTSLAAWRSDLVRRYGPVATRVQGPQRMMQWIWEDTMLRLTWRVEAGRAVASLSLVDGGVLDAWGRDAEQRIRPAPPPP